MNTYLPTFAEIYCERFDLAPEQFARHVLFRVLYPHAILLVPFARAMDSAYFASDFEFIRGVGRLRKRSEIDIEFADFAEDPSNSRFWRKHARVRASSGRMLTLIRRVYRGADSRRAEAPQVVAHDRTGDGGVERFGPAIGGDGDVVRDERAYRGGKPAALSADDNDGVSVW